ncbi:cutinase family protein [Candidatus Saccharibacteria bacterium]|nr:cutinase family protein [Candidatus Saccharibacteria bacterium]
MRGKKCVYLALAVGLIMASMPSGIAQAESCPDVRVVFARGSGGERWVDKNYLEYKKTIEIKLVTTDLDYEFIDLDYPAIGIGVDDIGVAARAFFGAGEAYEFGESVKDGVKKLDKLINNSGCSKTKYVLGGYSQGAMVVSKALGSLRADRVIYAATFGDPKLYLPEGQGVMPAACRGGKLSDYRMYVPDCAAYKGLLGAYIPYEPEDFTGKVGTWCNKRDIFCSSHLSMSDHLAYVSENLYEDASRVIFDKITQYFGIENHISSPHDTAIVIDSTGSMASMIDEYKAEALRLATETLNSGGRVALYDYRDLDDPYEPVKHCGFNDCTLEILQEELQNITADGGGDTPESLLSASFKVMTDLEWKQGSTKSLVVLTDADFLSPDRDGMSFDEVVQLSKRIDPVNFYIITTPEYAEMYKALAEATDGKVVTDFDELSLLIDYIMSRYDSLPRVEEDDALEAKPSLTIDEVKQIGDGAMKVKFTTNGHKVLVALNERVLGIIEEPEVVIHGLTGVNENILTLIPLGDDVRGEAVSVELKLSGYGRSSSENEEVIPKAPNTGKFS